MTLFNRASDSHKFLCALLAALVAAGPSTSLAQQPPGALVQTPAEQTQQPQSGKSDTTLLGQASGPTVDAASIIPDACAVVAFRPAQLLTAPSMAMLPIEVVQAALIKEIGLDPLTAEQLVVSASPPMQGPPHYAVIAKFNQPFKMKPSGMTEHAEKGSLNGKPYLKSREPMLPSFFPLAADTLIAAPEYTLPQFLDAQPGAKPEPGRLATQFAAASKGDDLLVMVDVEALRQLAKMGLQQAGPIPAELAPLAQLPDLIRLIELRLNLSKPGVSELIVTANNEADAAQLIKIFNDAKSMIRAQVDAESSQGLASDDPVEQAAARYSQRMSRMWDERMQIVQEGDRLVLFRTDAAAGGNQMVTTATIGVLVALLLPAVQAARSAARRSTSMNNLKQIVLGLFNHESARGSFPAQANFDDEGKPLLSWRVHILPYMEQQGLYQQFHLDEPWDSEHNKALIPLMPEVFLDPESRLTAAEGKTHYLGVAGEKHLFTGGPEGRKLQDITDGTSNSISIVQVDDDAAVVWTKPEDWTPDEDEMLEPFDPLHAGDIFLAAMCDGSVRAISRQIDLTVLKAMLTVDGGEVINAQ